MVKRKEDNDQESSFKTPKGKKDALKVTASQSKHYKQKAKRTVSSNGYQTIKNHKGIHAKTYSDRYSKSQQKVFTRHSFSPREGLQHFPEHTNTEMKKKPLKIFSGTKMPMALGSVCSTGDMCPIKFEK